ncbi:MAG: hypothetical protein RIC89_15860 [Pseudomonadales bacterium]
MDAMPESGTDPQCSPAISQLIVLPIDHIKPFERNPRHTPNAARERIKDSIRENGLDHALAVTQPPGAEHYLLSAGGATRLEILRELFEETDEPRFARIPCVLTPWPGEAEVMLAHLRENDLRGELSFIDKARAVIDYKALLEAEHGEPLSQQALSDTLMQRGYGLSQSMVSHIVYAVERLLPVIPIALEQGLGRPQVQRIRHLDRTASRLWHDCGLEKELPYDDAFLTLCRRYDGPDWSFAGLEEAMAIEIAEGADRSIQAVRLDLRTSIIEEKGGVQKSKRRPLFLAGLLQILKKGRSMDPRNVPIPEASIIRYRANISRPWRGSSKKPTGHYRYKAQVGLHPATIH